MVGLKKRSDMSGMQIMRIPSNLRDKKTSINKIICCLISYHCNHLRV